MRCGLVLGLPGGQPADRHARPTCGPNCCARRSASSTPRSSRTTTPTTSSAWTTCGCFPTTWAIRCRSTAKSRSKPGFASRSTMPLPTRPRTTAAACRRSTFTRITTEPFEVLAQRVDADSAGARPVSRARLSLRQHRLLHRHQRHSAGELAAAGRAGRADARRPAPQAASDALQPGRSGRGRPASAGQANATSPTCRTTWSTRRPTPRCRRAWNWPTTGCGSRSADRRRPCRRVIACRRWPPAAS